MALAGNKAIEEAAIAFVIDFERAAGRDARGTRCQGAVADIESRSRVVEVKAVGKESARSDGFLWLETRQVEAARESADFFLYLVENVRQSDPEQFTLRIFGGEQLQRLPRAAKEKRYFEVPLPVGEYDAAPVVTASGV